MCVHVLEVDFSAVTAAVIEVDAHAAGVLVDL